VPVDTRLGELLPPLSGASKVFTSIDWYVTDRLWRWLRKKRPTARARDFLRAHRASSRRGIRKLWRDDHREQYLLAWTPICRYRLRMDEDA